MKNSQPLELQVRNTDQLGNTIKRFRKQESWIQAEAGKRGGINQKIVSAIENGIPGTRIETLFKLLAALDLELVVRKRRKSTDLPETTD